MEDMKKNYFVDEETGAVTFFDDDDGIFDTGIMLLRKREPSKKLKKMIWIYYVEGKIRKEVRSAVLVPRAKDDFGGYVSLEDVFDGRNEMPLYEVRSSFEGKDGKKVKNVYYMVKDEIAPGVVISANLKPQVDSAQGIIETLIALTRFKKEQEAGKAAQTTDGGDVTPETPPAETPGKKNKS